MNSRRRRGPPRSTGQGRGIQVTAPQGGPSGPALITDRISTTPVIDDDLHFKTGLWGWLARFFVRLRAAGDPFDATLVLPCTIFLVLARLNDLGRVDARAVIAGLVIPASVAGFRIGAAYRGARGVNRAMLRSVLVGAIEGAAVVALVKEVINTPEALHNIFNLIYINFFFFWIFSTTSSTLSNVLTQSEQEWQIVVARRARIRRSMHGVVGFAQGVFAFAWFYIHNYITNHLFNAVLNAIVTVVVVYELPKLFALASAFIQNHFPF